MDLELQVYKKEIGKLETNIDDLEKFVTERIKEYEPKQYQGDVESAKKDRAELNNAEKKIATVRKDLIAELMKPYSDVETRLKALEKNIKFASGKLDEIVKEKENEEKQIKRVRCLELWNTFEFSLFPMDKVFNETWTNKTKKEKDILAEMKVIVDRTYKDLQTIESFASKEDVEILKTRYLEDLDISEIFSLGEEMKKNRERIAEEERERENREFRETLKQQKEELQAEQDVYNDSKDMNDIVNEALGIATDNNFVPKEEVAKEYVISVTLKENELLDLKRILLNAGIPINSINEVSF